MGDYGIAVSAVQLAKYIYEVAELTLSNRVQINLIGTVSFEYRIYYIQNGQLYYRDTSAYKETIFSANDVIVPKYPDLNIITATDGSMIFTSFYLSSNLQPVSFDNINGRPVIKGYKLNAGKYIVRPPYQNARNICIIL